MRKKHKRMIRRTALVAAFATGVALGMATVHSAAEMPQNQTQAVEHDYHAIFCAVTEQADTVEKNAPVVEPTYTAEDLELLALVIYQEAGADACSDETRLMVGNVVLNRVADDRYPDTIEEVLLEKRQYGRLYWTGIQWPERASKPEEAHAVERAYRCAREVLSGVRLLPDDVIFQSEYVQGTEIVAEQDGFYFCRG